MDLMRTSVFVCLFLSMLTGHAHAQGSLAPPSAPAPGMLRLDQVEPRTPITNLPYTISESGSYYVTGSLTSTNEGIKVGANNVTLDLMGFPISGSQVPGSIGIHVQGGEDIMLVNVAIMNGSIREFERGIVVENARGGRIRDLIVSANTSSGIELTRYASGSCTDYTIEDCIVRDNQGTGIYLNNGAGGLSLHKNHVIRRCSVSGNGTYGINAVFTSGCVIDGNVIGPQAFTSNTFGVRSINGSGNFIVRNFENGNTNGYSFSPGSDTRGPVVTTSGALSFTNSDSSPWANFSR